MEGLGAPRMKQYLPANRRIRAYQERSKQDNNQKSGIEPARLETFSLEATHLEVEEHQSQCNVWAHEGIERRDMQHAGRERVDSPNQEVDDAAEEADLSLSAVSEDCF